jgi:uncharacterized LabA/DUF88 family protein
MEKRLKIKGKAAVFIDWANVYGWEKSLKKEIDTGRLFEYLRTYPEISCIRLYFGTDNNQKSREFLQDAEVLGYTIITKLVKYIVAAQFDGQKIYRRKCDFDMEACIDAHRLSEYIDSFIFFTGDGDFDPLYRLLIDRGKQVMVVYTAGHLGREIWAIRSGLFKIQLKNLAPEALVEHPEENNDSKDDIKVAGEVAESQNNKIR